MSSSKTFELSFIKPTVLVRAFINNAWVITSIKLVNWMRSDLLNALVYGGLGIKGIAQTEFYKWVISDEGLSELGIPATEPPKLLESYLNNAFSIKATSQTIHLQFGDILQLKLDTPHPAAGTGQLNIKSWMEWVFDGESAPDHGFVPRDKIPTGMQNSIRLSPPLGGLMLPDGMNGSTGSWKLPESFITYDLRWYKENESQITSAIFAKLIELLQQELV